MGKFDGRVAIITGGGKGGGIGYGLSTAFAKEAAIWSSRPEHQEAGRRQGGAGAALRREGAGLPADGGVEECWAQG